MNTRNYFDDLVEKNKDANFDDVFELINPDYVGKSVGEVIENILKSEDVKDAVRLTALIQKTKDDVLDLKDEIEIVEKEYKEKLDQAIVDQAQVNQEKMVYGIRYNELKHYQEKIATYEQDRINENRERLLQIEYQIKSINNLVEKVGEENVSDRKLRIKKELETEKKELESKKFDLEDSKKEAFYLARQLESKEKRAQEKKKQIIEELNQKKTDINIKISNKNQLRDKLTYLSSIMLVTFANKYEKNLEKYEEANIQFNEALESKDYDKIIDTASALKEIKTEKELLDKIDVKLTNNVIDALGYEVPVNEIVGIDENYIEDKPALEVEEEKLPEEQPALEVEEEKLPEEQPALEVEEEKLPEEQPALEVESTPNVVLPSIEKDEPTEIYLTAKSKGIDDGTASAATVYETQYTGNAESMPINQISNVPSESSTDYNEVYNYFYNKTWNEHREDMIALEKKAEENKKAQELETENLVEDNKLAVADNLEVSYLDDNDEFNIDNLNDSQNDNDLNDDYLDTMSDDIENKTNESGFYDPSTENLDNELTDNPEDLGFAPNPANPNIEEQSENPIDLNDVMPEINKMDNTFRPATDDDLKTTEEDNLEFIMPETKEPELPIQPVEANFENDIQTNIEKPILEQQKESQPMVEQQEEQPLDFTTENQQEEVSSQEDNSDEKHEGFFKKIFGKKDKKESKVEKVEESSDNVVSNAIDKLHSRYLDEEGYETWKATVENKSKGK